MSDLFDDLPSDASADAPNGDSPGDSNDASPPPEAPPSEFSPGASDGTSSDPPASSDAASGASSSSDADDGAPGNPLGDTDLADLEQAGTRAGGDAPRKKKHVAIAGNIGAGKSSLTEILSTYFGWEAFYEQVDNNPYLTDFYNDMRRWSFNLQVFFLSQRFKHQRRIDECDHSVVQDRSIYEDAEIFARNLHEMGLMSARDYENYTELFSIMTSYLKAPSLLVYLRSSVPTLVNHIQSRGRNFESTIRIDYLERLQEHYENWISSYDLGPKMIIDVDELDFVNDDADRRDVINRIESRLFGLFPDE